MFSAGFCVPGAHGIEDSNKFGDPQSTPDPQMLSHLKSLELKTLWLKEQKIALFCTPS
jgi:hypothetical protein